MRIIRILVTVSILLGLTNLSSTPADIYSGISITDAAGRRVLIPKPPRRIAVVGQGFYILLHTLYMFPRGRERLVGTEKRGRFASEFLSLIDPGFDRKIFLAPHSGPEQIATLRPDLVLAKGTVSGNLDISLDRIGIPVVYLDLETPAAFFQDVHRLGRILESEQRAEEVIRFYSRRLEHLRKMVQTIPAGERSTVLVVKYNQRGGTAAVNVPGWNWMQAIQVRTAGGIPVWGDTAQQAGAWTIVNLEQIANWDPDRILVIIPHAMDSLDVIQRLRDNPQWSGLRAVKTNQIHPFPADIYGWDNPDPRWILGMIWMAHRLYPEKWAEQDIKEEIQAYFNVLYGMDVEAVSTVILPRLTPGLI